MSPVQSLVACVCLSFVLPLRLYNNYEVPTIIYTHPIQPPAAEFLARFFFLVLSLVSCCVRSYKLLAPSWSQPQPGQPQQQLPCVIKQIQKYLATSIHSNGVSRGETFLDTLLGRWVWVGHRMPLDALHCWPLALQRIFNLGKSDIHRIRISTERQVLEMLVDN